MAVFGSSSTIQLDTIIFATDFSPASHNAGLYASAVSKRFNTELVVAHGFTLVQAAIEADVLKSRPSQQRIDLKHDLTLVAEILEAGRGKTEAVLLSGDPNKVISAYAQSRHPSLLVLGTHGGGSIDRFLLGSTAEGILRQTMGAALTIGPRVDILQAGALNIRRILYATDCSAEAAYAAPAAIALAEVFQAELDVLNVVQSTSTEHPEQLKKLQEHFYGAVESRLPHSAEKLSEPHTFVCAGEPARQILKHIEERSIDLLVLGLRRNTHLGMQNRTSGAFPIIVAAPCPVVTVAHGSAIGSPARLDASERKPD